LTKKKSKTRRWMEKNSVGLLEVVVTIIIGLLTINYSRTVVIINQTYVPPAAQASWHTVESWQLGASATATTQTLTFDWAGFLGDVSWCVTLGVAGLIGLYRWKNYHWKTVNWRALMNAH